MQTYTWLVRFFVPPCIFMSYVKAYKPFSIFLQQTSMCSAVCRQYETLKTLKMSFSVFYLQNKTSVKNLNFDFFGLKPLKTLGVLKPHFASLCCRQQTTWNAAKRWSFKTLKALTTYKVQTFCCHAYVVIETPKQPITTYANIYATWQNVNAGNADVSTNVSTGGQSDRSKLGQVNNRSTGQTNAGQSFKSRLLLVLLFCESFSPLRPLTRPWDDWLLTFFSKQSSGGVGDIRSMEL